ncbi:MAG TPA: glucoamylase family protein [Bacteroidota bacterium]|nr:glucoamylase family protein [Bacteroidota bacterium]
MKGNARNRRIGGGILLALLAVHGAPAQMSDDAILDTVQHGAFNFFWQQANASNGLIKDRSAPGAPCSIASLGFGLSAICIGVDHGWVSRAAARDRVMTALQTLWDGPQGIGDGYTGLFGLFYHFLDMTTARRAWTSELSTIDTGLLLAGIVDARQYFDGADSSETALRALADSIYHRMNWAYMRNGNPGIMMGYMPGSGFQPYVQWVGYNEASIMYILALGSPTYPVDSRGWQTWTSGYVWLNEYGYTYVIFPPLFGHQYTACWIDYRGIADDYMRWVGSTYFANSRSATLAQQAYCIANQMGFAGYSDSLWGITASDVPASLHGGNTYMARGAPPDQDDDGTITPTAPISSIAFAPEAVLPVIRNLWNNYRAQMWTPYGFRDAFNLSTKVPWYDTDIIGIDQGPEIIMIENYRTGRVWKRFMKNPDVQRGLAAAGFLPVTGVAGVKAKPASFTLGQNFPNPFNPATVIAYELPAPGWVRLTVCDVLGREVATLVNGPQESGPHRAAWNAAGCASGTYFYTLRSGAYIRTRTMLLVR